MSVISGYEDRTISKIWPWLQTILASPWALPWLDLVRFMEELGFIETFVNFLYRFPNIYRGPQNSHV